MCPIGDRISSRFILLHWNQTDWFNDFTRTVGRRLVLLFISEQYIFFRLSLLFCVNIVETKKQQVLFKIKSAKIQAYQSILDKLKAGQNVDLTSRNLSVESSKNMKV